jgi:hypothetical protein
MVSFCIMVAEPGIILIQLGFTGQVCLLSRSRLAAAHKYKQYNTGKTSCGATKLTTVAKPVQTPVMSLVQPSLTAGCLLEVHSGLAHTQGYLGTY